MRSLYSAIGAVLVAGYAGCGLITEGIDADKGFASSTGAGGNIGSPCAVRDECPADTECATYACTNGSCALTQMPDGTVIPGGIKGDCLGTVCVAGVATTQPDDTDTKVDANECTIETCSGGSAVTTLVKDGTPCGNDLVCKAGDCTGCTSVQQCNPPIACQKLECFDSVCVYTTDTGKEVDPTAPNDCIHKVCNSDGTINEMAPNPSEVPTQDADICNKEECGQDGTIVKTPMNEDQVCGPPMGVCFDPSRCKTGACAPKPKPDGEPLANDPTPGDCQDAVCDGLGGMKSVADNTDVPKDANADDCIIPLCSMGLPNEGFKGDGDACGAGGAQECCTGVCCATGTASCVAGACCASGASCGNQCCVNAGASCDNMGMCCETAKICLNTCCPTGHDCQTVSGVCCPAAQRCADGKKCCPLMLTCDAGNNCI